MAIRRLPAKLGVRDECTGYGSLFLARKERRWEMHHEDEVRLIAYGIWEEEGHHDGQDLEHWFKAEAIWQGQQGQAEHMAEDLPSRTDLPTSRVDVKQEQARRRPRHPRG